MVMQYVMGLQWMGAGLGAGMAYRCTVWFAASGRAQGCCLRARAVYRQGVPLAGRKAFDASRWARSSCVGWG